MTYYERNRDKLLARQKEYYHKNKHLIDKEKVKIYNHNYFENHKDHLLKKFHDKYYNNRPQKIKKTKIKSEQKPKSIYNCEVCDYHNIRYIAYYKTHLKTKKHQKNVYKNQPQEVDEIKIFFS